MDKRVASEVVVQEARNSTNALKCPPEDKIFHAIASIQCHNLTALDTEIFHHPVTDSYNELVELAICIVLALERDEKLVWTLVQTLVTEYMIVGQSTLCHSLCDPSRTTYAVDEESKIVGDVVFGVQVRSCCRGTGCGGNEREDCSNTTILALTALILDWDISIRDGAIST